MARTDQDSFEIPHRKNAAEWMMWIILWPIARVMRWIVYRAFSTVLHRNN